MSPKKTPTKRKVDEIEDSTTNATVDTNTIPDVNDINMTSPTLTTFSGISPPLARRLRSSKKIKRTRSKSRELHHNDNQKENDNNNSHSYSKNGDSNGNGNDNHHDQPGDYIDDDMEDIDDDMEDIHDDMEDMNDNVEDSNDNIENINDNMEDMNENMEVMNDNNGIKGELEVMNLEPIQAEEQELALILDKEQEQSMPPVVPEPQLPPQLPPIPVNVPPIPTTSEQELIVTSPLISNGTTITKLPFARLRMPSQHTPKKVDQPLFPLMIQPLPPPPSVHRVTTLPERNLEYQNNQQDDIMMKLQSQPQTPIQPAFQAVRNTLQDVVRSMIVPNSTCMNHVDTPNLKYKWIICSLLTLFVQIMFIHHIWATDIVEHTSTSTILRVKDWMGVLPKIVEQITHVQLPDEVIITYKQLPLIIDPKLHLGQLDNLQTMTQHLQTLKENSHDLNKVRHDIEPNLREHIRPAMDQRKQTLRQWELSLQQAESQLDMLRQYTDHPTIPAFVHRVRIALTRADTLTTPLIHATLVPMWSMVPESASCPTEVPIQDALLTFEEMKNIEEEFVEMSASFVESVIHNTTLRATVQTWTHNQLSSMLPHVAVVEDDFGEMSFPHNDTLSNEDVENVIFDSLERLMADKMGVIDYASLYAGASIIQHGPRATSPSLIDTLPLVNQFLVFTNLRFYGYGPEAALTPTKPNQALGQCWSFTDASQSKKQQFKHAHRMDNTNGKYATLSVQLAKPTYIGSIVVEHPPRKEQQPSSALQSFRLFGYMDPQASTRPYLLGEFTFHWNEKSSSSIQTFPISNMMDMAMRSITVAIDSSYGHDYTCLYRFRVQAK